MKRTLALLTVGAIAAFGASGCATDRQTSPCCCRSSGVACVCPQSSAGVKLNAATADDLRTALQDERLAQAFYTAVMAKHGDVRPFAMIVHAEERHEAVLTSLMERHGVAVPSDMPTNAPAVGSTLTECNRIAAQLERDNIAMYDRMLATITEPDVRMAFENLRAASLNNHLPAFERWSKG